MPAYFYYYFVFYIPNEAKLARERRAIIYSQELSEKQIKAANELRGECIKVGKKITYEFGLDNTVSSPVFYPYEDINSFNKNKTLYTALSVYISCLEADPRNTGNRKSKRKKYCRDNKV